MCLLGVIVLFAFADANPIIAMLPLDVRVIFVIRVDLVPSPRQRSCEGLGRSINTPALRASDHPREERVVNHYLLLPQCSLDATSLGALCLLPARHGGRFTRRERHCS